MVVTRTLVCQLVFCYFIGPLAYLCTVTVCALDDDDDDDDDYRMIMKLPKFIYNQSRCVHSIKCST